MPDAAEAGGLGAAETAMLGVSIQAAPPPSRRSLRLSHSPYTRRWEVSPPNPHRELGGLMPLMATISEIVLAVYPRYDVLRTAG